MTAADPLTGDLFGALREREAGQDRVLAATDQDYLAALEGAIDELAAGGSDFTSDDVRRLAGDPPAGIHFNVAGAAISRAAKAGRILRTGYAISSRVVGHGNLIRTWRRGAR